MAGANAPATSPCYPARVRRFTLIVIICLFLVIVGAAVAQIVIASRNHDPYPGPVPGTPYPTASPTP